MTFVQFSFILTRSELLTSRVDLYLGLSSNGQLFRDVGCSLLGDGEHRDERFVVDKRALCARQLVQEVRLQLLHLPLVRSDAFYQALSLCFQLLPITPKYRNLS